MHRVGMSSVLNSFKAIMRGIIYTSTLEQQRPPLGEKIKRAAQVGLRILKKRSPIDEGLRLLKKAQPFCMKGCAF